LNEKDPDTVAEDTTGRKPEVVIKKYANRRLYNTATSAYVTLDDLAAMVKSGTDFLVFDAKTGDDITRSVLTQIIVEEENKGQNLLPINFLRQLIGLYGHSMETVVPSYLEFSLDALVREQEKLSKQFVKSFGAATPFRAIEEQAKRNVSMFEQAMKLFNPFAILEAEREKKSERRAEPASPPPAHASARRTRSAAQTDLGRAAPARAVGQEKGLSSRLMLFGPVRPGHDPGNRPWPGGRRP
jgi:polyhydroxyalkanoate synthesis repressor PhaR